MKTRISTPWQLTGGPYRLAKVVFQRLLLVSALGWLASTACGAERHWTGAGGDNSFSDPNNWNPVGALQEDDILVFPAGADAYSDPTPFVTFDSVRFTGSGTTRISGHPIQVRSRIHCQLTSGLAQIDLRVDVDENFAFIVDEGGTLSVTSGFGTLHPQQPSQLSKGGLGTLILATDQPLPAITVWDGVLIPMYEGPSSREIKVSGGTLHLVVPIQNPLSLGGNGTGGTNDALRVPANSSITLTSPIVLRDAVTINVGANASLALDSVIRGNGPLTKIGSGDLYLGGGSNNIYVGSTRVNAGTLYLSKDPNVIAVPGNLIVGPAPGSSAVARFNRSGMMNGSSAVTINESSLLDLNGNNQTLLALLLYDGGDVQTGAGTLGFRAGGSVHVRTSNPPEVGLRSSSSISGHIALPVLDYLTFDVAPYARGHFPGASELEIPAVIREAGNIIKLGEGALRLSGANTFNDSPPNFSGDVFVNGGSLIAAHANALGGTAGWTFVNNDALLVLAGDISFNGETLYLNTDNSPALDNRGNNIWNGPINLSRDSIIAAGQDRWLQVLGVVSGAGSLIKIGPGTVTLDGSAHNTFAGDTFVNEGTLELAKSASLQAVPANLVIGLPGGGPEAAALYWSHDQVWQDITVNGSGVLNLNGFNEFGDDLTLNGGGDVQTGTGVLYMSNLAVNPGGFADQSVISGWLGLYPGAHLFAVGAGSPSPGNADCLVSANIIQYTTSAGLVKTGAGLLRLTGANTYTGVTYLGGGTLQIDGVQPQSSVELDHETRLQGTGTVGHIILNGEATAIAPGTSPGTLTCSNFDGSGGSGKLEIELNSFPTGYDQIIARGAVDLRGLALKASLNFASEVGQQFTIINNEGSDAVTGTFTGLPQNGKSHIGAELFQITYTGGDGNDVVLTRLGTPPAPEAALSIGVNFAADEPPGVGSPLAPSDKAGVVPQANWNNVTWASGSASSLIKDFSGSAVPSSVSMEWSSPNTWSSTGRGEENNGFPLGPDRTLMTGHLDTTDLTSGAAVVTVSGLGPEFTTRGYDVIVYALGGVGGRGGGYTIGSTTKIGTAPTNPTNFVEDPGIDMTDVGNYMRFTNLHGASFTLRADASLGNFRAQINGIQIVAVVPEISVTTLPATEVPNYALDFDGTDDRVQLGTNAFPAVIDNFTIELWVNPTGFRTPTAEVNTGISDITNQCYAVFPDHGWDSYGGEDHAGAGLSIGTNGISVVEHGYGYLPTLLVYSNAISGWTHVALVYTNKVPSLYVNGALVRPGLLASGKTNVHPSASLGGSIQGIGYGNYQGQLDEVRIWDAPLSQTQIQVNMNRTLTGTESGLVAYYRCDENSGTSLTDSAPATPNNSGILTNGAAFVLSGALPPDAIYGPSVTLNGLANPGGVAGTVWFEWGATTNYGSVTAAQAVAGGFRNASFFHQLTALAAGSYHFRAAGSNSLNVSFGLDQSFTLLHGMPSLRIEPLPGGQVRLLWPTNGPLFRLQSSINLVASNWITASPPPVVLGTNNVVTNAAAATEKFYRLATP